jgi:hypothetical protein
VARREKGLRSSAPLPDSVLPVSASYTEALESVGMVESMPSLSVMDRMVLRPLQKEDMVMSTAMVHQAIRLRRQRSPTLGTAERIPGRRARSLALTHYLSCCFPHPFSPTCPPYYQIKLNFWNTLSSGQFLCVAYKIGVRQSRKPWGHINDDSIHDIVALEDALSASAVDGSQAESGRKG